jgi:hypothetical protein
MSLFLLDDLWMQMRNWLIEALEDESFPLLAVVPVPWRTWFNCSTSTTAVRKRRITNYAR